MFSRYYKLPILDIALLIYFEHCIIAIFLFQNILSEKSYPYFFFFSSQRFVSPLILLTQTDPSRRLLSQGPKFPFLSLFPLFMWNAYLSLFLFLSLSLSLSRHVYPYFVPLFFVFYFAELTRRYAHVGRRVHAHIDRRSCPSDRCCLGS